MTSEAIKQHHRNRFVAAMNGDTDDLSVNLKNAMTRFLNQSRPSGLDHYVDRWRRFEAIIKKLDLNDKTNIMLISKAFDSGALLYLNFVDQRYKMQSIDEQQNLHVLCLGILSYEDDAIIATLLEQHGIIQCDNCEQYEYKREASREWSGGFICRTCANDDYTYSGYYDRLVHNDDVRESYNDHGDSILISHDDNNFYWDDNSDEYLPVNNHSIGSYHSSKKYYLPQASHWSTLNRRWFGVELEVEVQHGSDISRLESARRILNHVNSSTIKNTGNNIFIENDGSLSHGFEIITQPMGLNKHEALWDWVNDKSLVKNLLSHKTSTCGLHVHVSRANISTMQLSKMITFINHPDNRSLIEAVARRYGSGYAVMSNKKLGNAWKSQYQRHEAVNVENDETIEFRIFRGSLKHQTIMACIEFVNALVEFCHDQSNTGFNLSTTALLNFIANNSQVRKDTMHLRSHLASRLDNLPVSFCFDISKSKESKQCAY